MAFATSSPESTNLEVLRSQVDQIVGYFDLLSEYDDSQNPYDAYPATQAENLREDEVVSGNEYTKKVCEYAEKENASVIVMCAKMESELAELEESDKKQFLSD